MKPQDEYGRFANKSESKRKVRSIRASDETWNKFQQIANSQRRSTADVLEDWVSTLYDMEDSAVFLNKWGELAEDVKSANGRFQRSILALREALQIPGNRGKQIKAKIFQALEHLN